MKKLLSLLVISGAVLGALFFLTSLSGNGAGGPPARTADLQPATSVQQGVLVSMEYTLTDEAGKVIESNVGKEPLTYVHGSGQIVRGLEKELVGMKVGEQKKIQVTPEEGYGLRDPNAVQEIRKDKIPAEAQQVGATLMTQAADGRSLPLRIQEIREKTVVVDFNHPLAGRTLNFDVRVTDLKMPR
jgi:FKBP-type peptidyl-prolyl cis-trans isomerase SlyD